MMRDEVPLYVILCRAGWQRGRIRGVHSGAGKPGGAQINICFAAWPHMRNINVVRRNNNIIWLEPTYRGRGGYCARV